MVTSLEIYVIYFNPEDYPGKYVVRRQIASNKGVLTDRKCTLHTTLKEARSAIPITKTNIKRMPEDVACIVETWI